MSLNAQSYLYNKNHWFLEFSGFSWNCHVSGLLPVVVFQHTSPFIVFVRGFTIVRNSRLLQHFYSKFSVIKYFVWWILNVHVIPQSEGTSLWVYQSPLTENILPSATCLQFHMCWQNTLISNFVFPSLIILLASLEGSFYL